MKPYDIFISYRRDSYESANLIATRLKAAGYRVFFDLETMRSGLFNEQIYKVIEECRDVVAVLPPNALDRCADPEDWVRKELVFAMEHKKNIVPVMLNGFQWPRPMPAGMEELCMYQAVTASKDYFDLAMQRLEGYLKIRRYTSLRKRLTVMSLVLIAVLVICFSAMAIFRYMARPVCREVTEYLTYRIGEVDQLMDDNLKLKEVLKGYSPEKHVELAEEIDSIISNLEYQESYCMIEPLALDGWQQFLAGLYGVNSTTLNGFMHYVDSFYEDLYGNLRDVAEMLDSSEPIYPSVVDSFIANADIFTHTVNALYYSYLEVVNHLPADSQEIYRSLARKFVNMPNTGLGLQRREYEMLVEREMSIADRLLGGISSDVHEMEDQLQDVNIKQNSLYQSVLEQYHSYIEKNKIDETEECGVNWFRICSVSSFLEGICLEHDGEEDPITSDMVLADLESMLDKYADIYTETIAYVSSARRLYRDVAAGKRPLAGVLVYAFAPGCSHDIYHIGDIIVSWNGIAVSSLNELKNVYKKSFQHTGKLELLRLENDSLVKMTIDIPGNEDVVGFMDLKLAE